MHFTWNTLMFINFVLSFALLIFGIISSQRTKSKFVLYVAIAFGLFGLTHLASLFSLNEPLNILLIVIRIVAYLLVGYSFYSVVNKKV